MIEIYFMHSQTEYFFFLTKIWLFDSILWQKYLDILFFEWSIWGQQNLKLELLILRSFFLKNVIVYILLSII